MINYLIRIETGRDAFRLLLSEVVEGNEGRLTGQLEGVEFAQQELHHAENEELSGLMDQNLSFLQAKVRKLLTINSLRYFLVLISNSAHYTSFIRNYHFHTITEGNNSLRVILDNMGEEFVFRDGFDCVCIHILHFAQIHQTA